MAGELIRFTISIAGMGVLARQLVPEDFGMIDMVMALTGFALVLKDAGLSMATVQRKEITHEQVSTLFWINIAISLGLTAIVAGSSPLVAMFYGDSRLAGVTLGVSVSFLVGGLIFQHQALMRRQMRFRALTVIQILAMLIATALAIVTAWLGFGYWALVVRIVSVPAFTALLLWHACPWRPGLPKRGTGVRGMLKFGMNLTGSHTVNYIARNGDNILIGRFVGPGPLGLYARAYRLLLLPIQQVNGPAGSFVIPVLSRIQDEPQRFRRFYVTALETLTLVTVPMIIYAMAAAHRLVPCILGQGWDEVILIFRALGGAALVGTVNISAGWLFICLNRTDKQFRAVMAHSLGLLAAFLIGLNWGVLGVAIACSTATVVMRVPYVLYACSGTPVRPRDILFSVLRPCFCSVVAGASALAVDLWLLKEWSPDLAAAVIMLLVFVAVFFASLLAMPSGRNLLGSTLTMVRDLTGRSAQ